MSLAPGSRVGAYEVQELLGSGGMGEVYRARDPRLGRDVAIKVLPAGITGDPDRVRRFEQEARAAATLSHPNILAVYDIGQTTATDETPATAFIVMELLPGETLRDRTQAGPLPVRKAIDTAIQIANGLAAAHEKGVVHRDLKPENIFVTDAGHVKILDFGLAKLTEVTPSTSSAEVPTRRADTQPGMVMGTAGYMSPEQVRGLTVDHRTDIFSFGAVLYELLAGSRAFNGATAADVMTAILKEHPPDLPAAERHLPPALTRILDRCLEKQVSARFQSAGDLAFALQALSAHSGATETMPAIAAAPSRRASAGWIVAAGLGLALIAAIAYPQLRRPVDTGPRSVTTFPIVLPDGWTLALSLQFTSVSIAPIAVSPDGAHIALLAANASGVRRIVVRSRDSLAARVLDGTDGATAPFWSPDSQHLAYYVDGRLYKIAATGGQPFPICETQGQLGGTWNQNGVILFGVNQPGAGLQRVADSGGVPARATEAPSDERHSRPVFLPDGRHFLYRVTKSNEEVNGPIYAGSLDSADRTHVVDADSANVAYSSGHVLFMRQSTLMAQRFDPDRLTTSGDPFPVADSVRALGTVPVGVFSASANGVLAYQTGSLDAGSQLTWIDLTATPVGTVGDRGFYADLRLSPDSTHAAVSRRKAISADERSDIWIIDLLSGLGRRFTFDPGDELATAWFADGKQIVFNSSKKGALDLYQKAADNSGPETELLVSNVDKFPADVSRDGKYLLYAARVGGPGREATVAAARAGQPGAERAGRAGGPPNQRLHVLPLTGDRTPIDITSDEMAQIPGTFSPDGRWIVFSGASAPGQLEIYVVPFPKRDGRWQISKNGGTTPRWGRDGIYWLQGGSPPTLMMARVDAAGAAIKVLEIKTLGRVYPAGTRGTYSVAQDGQRILINSSQASQAVVRPPPTVVVDWTAGKKR